MVRPIMQGDAKMSADQGRLAFVAEEEEGETDAHSKMRNKPPSGDRKRNLKCTYSNIGQSSGDEGKDSDSESNVPRYGRNEQKRIQVLISSTSVA
jgi:hypothetical protein